MKEKYESPLLQFKAYRLTPQYYILYGNTGKPPPLSLTITNSYHGLWPLCQFDVRGKCLDMRCGMQHMQDGQLSFKEAVQEYEPRLKAVGVKQPGLLEAKGGRPAPTTSAEVTERLYAASYALAQQGRSLSSLVKACSVAEVSEKQVSRGRVALLPLEARVRAALQGEVPSYVAYKGGVQD
jgi:hypothetical protein